MNDAETRRADLLLVGLTLAIKVALLAGGAAAYLWFNLHAESALGVWNRWDAPHYLDLVVFGYRATDAGDLIGPHGYRSVYPGDLPLYIVFYPLYPWLTAAVNALLDSPVLSAIVVSGVASAFVAPLMYRLAAIDEGPDVAMRAAWFLLVFPTAYFLHIGYTEALFMALALGSFLAARTDRWWLAGLLGALATLSRVNGLVLIPALAAEALTQYWEQPVDRRHIRVSWLAIGLVALGFLAYLALNLAVYDDPFRFLFVQRTHWSKALAPPWEGIGHAFDYLQSSDVGDALLYGAMELLFAGIALAGTIYAAFFMRPSWFVWMTGNLVLITSTTYLFSTPRYALVLFPLFVVMARLTRDRRALVGLSAVSIAAFIYFAGRFAADAWAF